MGIKDEFFVINIVESDGNLTVIDLYAMYKIIIYWDR